MPPARRFVPGSFPRLYLVTPAVVERTIRQTGVGGILNDRERVVLDGFALEKRRRDWLAGRLAAKRAIRAAVRTRLGMTVPYPAITVRNATDGSPRVAVEGHSWFENEMNLSLAHCDGTAVATVARTATVGSVGVDIERMVPLDLAIVHRVMGPREISLLSAGRASPHPLAIWTVKEAAFKAARTACTALRDVELDWTTASRVSARLVGADASPHSLAVTHNAIGEHTVAIALYCPAA